MQICLRWGGYVSSHLLQQKSCLALGKAVLNTQPSQQLPKPASVVSEELQLMIVFLPGG